MCVSVCREGGAKILSRVWRAVVKEERPSSSKIRRRKEGLQIHREILRQKKSEETRRCGKNGTAVFVHCNETVLASWDCCTRLPQTVVVVQSLCRV